MKRLLAALLSLSIVICLLPAFAIASSAEDAVITVDGIISDWAGLDCVYVETADERNVTFYAVKTSAGLYLAADAYHGVYSTTTYSTWYDNTNFEIFVKNNGASNGQEQYYISAWNKSSMTDPTVVTMKGGALCVDRGAMLTEEIDDGAAHYHTVAEMFIAKEHLPKGVFDFNEITVGMAWKTVGDGADIYTRTNDVWWYFRDAVPNPARRFVVNEDGLRYITDSTGAQQAGDFSGTWTVEGNIYTNTVRATGSGNGNSFATYILGNKKFVDFTTKVNLSDGLEYALIVGGTDVNGDKILDESRDAYYLIDLKTGDGKIGIEKNTAEWTGWAVRSAANAMPLNSDAEVRVTTDSEGGIRVYVNGNVVIDYVDTEYPLKGTGYGFANKPSDGAVFTLVADNSSNPSASAAVTAESASISTGDDVTFTVALSYLDEVSALSVQTIFDSDEFELVSGEWLPTGAALSGFNTDSGVGVIGWSAAQMVNGDVFTFTLRVTGEQESTSVGCTIQYEDGGELIAISAIPVELSIHVHSYAINYTWSEDNLTVTATATCSGCDKVITETVNTSYAGTQPNCDTAGTGTYTAEFENDVFETQIKEIEIDAEGHSLEHVEATEATHFEAGNIDYWHCTVCEKYFSDANAENEIEADSVIIPIIPHDFGDEWKYDETNHWHECECGEKTGTAAHTFGEWKVTVEPKYTAEGEQERVCSVCGYVETETIDKKEVKPVYGGEDGDGSAELSDEDWQDITDAIKYCDNDTDITIILGDSSVGLSGEILEKIKEELGDDANLRIEAGEIDPEDEDSGLSEQQAEIINAAAEGSAVFGVRITDDTGVLIGAGSSVDVETGFELSEGASESDVAVYEIGEDGAPVVVHSEYANGIVSFTANNGSVYVITTAPLTEVPPTGDYTAAIIVLSMIAVIALGAAACVSSRKKMTE